MDFRTEHTPHRLPFSLTHATRILATGSCFATAIGKRLEAGMFRCVVNPFGTVYNPLSIHGQLVDALASHSLHPSHWVPRGTLLLHHAFHSSLAAPDAHAFAARVQEVQSTVRAQLTANSLLMLTYGTAWVFRKSGDVVANCHKVPASEFARELLSLSQIQESFDELNRTLRQVAPAADVLLTVSPVRHLREGVEENAVSKATLRLACHELSKHYPRVHYFPAYELLLDDLRDYRFYSEDLVHPSAAAEKYIWEKFKTACMDGATLRLLDELDRLRAFLDHRPLDVHDAAYQAKRQKALARMDMIKGELSINS